jgi:hypothetical protein
MVYAFQPSVYGSHYLRVFNKYLANTAYKGGNASCNRWASASLCVSARPEENQVGEKKPA